MPPGLIVFDYRGALSQMLADGFPSKKQFIGTLQKLQRRYSIVIYADEREETLRQEIFKALGQEGLDCFAMLKPKGLEDCTDKFPQFEKYLEQFDPADEVVVFEAHHYMKNYLEKKMSAHIASRQCAPEKILLQLNFIQIDSDSCYRQFQLWQQKRQVKGIAAVLGTAVCAVALEQPPVMLPVPSDGLSPASAVRPQPTTLTPQLTALSILNKRKIIDSADDANTPLTCSTVSSIGEISCASSLDVDQSPAANSPVLFRF